MEIEALLRHRILFLSEPVNSISANRLIGQLLLLDADNPESPIDLYINSMGGTVLDGLAVIDTMQCIQAPVSTFCIGQAASMAAWILAAGTPGRRYAAPNAEIMIHQMAAGIQGETSDIEVHAQRILRLQDRLIHMFAKWTQQSADKVRKDMERDFFMTSEEALNYGIIDAILEPFTRSADRS